MDQRRVPTSRDIIYSLLQACTKKKDLAAARRVYLLMVSSGLHSVTVLGDHLIRLFTLCESLLEAKQVFWKIPKPSVYTWNAIISAHAKLGESKNAVDLYHNMHIHGTKPDRVTFLCTLKACSNMQCIEQGRLIYDDIIRSGFESDVVIGNTILDMYTKCGRLGEAFKVFDSMLMRNEVSWQAMIVGYTQNGNSVPALGLLMKMQHEGLTPNKVIFLCVLKACGATGDISHCRVIHGQIRRCGLQSDVVIGSALVDIYAKCGNLEEACRVFDELPIRNLFTWGAVIAAHVGHGYALAALDLFENMQQERIIPDEVVFSSILKACCSIGAIKVGMLIHEQIIRSGLQEDRILGNTLVDMYAKSGSLEEAIYVFDKLSDRDVVSWGAMITGCMQHERALLALELFERMQYEGNKPSMVTHLCILKACGSTGAIAQGRLIHDHIIRNGIELDEAIGNSLVDMYAKCMSLHEAQRVFEILPNPDTVSWGAMIAGYAQNGCSGMAIQCYLDMRQQGLKPDVVIFTSVLVAHSHSGLLVEGCQYFKSMKDNHGFAPDIGHFNGMIDLLGRAGCLDQAEDLLRSMPISPDPVAWRSLLAGCRIYGNVELGRECFDHLINLNPNDASCYVLMSNIYADAQLWEDLTVVQERRKCIGALKRPGKAWIEVDTKVQEFIVGGYGHSQSFWIYTKLGRLHTLMKEEGHVSLLDLVMGHISDEDKEDVWVAH